MNEREFDDAVGQWRVAEVPSIPPLPKARSRRNATFVVAGLASTTVLGVFAFATLSVPQVSLGQVVEATKQVRTYTMVNRRIMGSEKRNGFSIKIVQDGDVASVTTTWADSSTPDTMGWYSLGSSFYWHKKLAFVIQSPARKLGSYVDHFSPRMFKDPSSAKVLKTTWEGKQVTVFTAHAKGHGYDVDETMTVDARTRLPLRYLRMCDGGSWGDEWRFDYSVPSKSELKLAVPAGIPVIDQRPQTAALKNLIAQRKGAVAALLVGKMGDIACVFSGERISKPKLKGYNYIQTECSIEGLPASTLWGNSVSDKELINGLPILVATSEIRSGIPAQLRDAREVSGTFSIHEGGEKTSRVFKFSNVPVLHVGSSSLLIEEEVVRKAVN
jgi:hypothetical protein